MDRKRMARWGLWMGLAAMVAVGGGRSAPAAEGAKRIAVVNVSRVFNAYKKVENVQEKLKAQFDGRRKELEQEQKDLRQLGDVLRLETEQKDVKNDPDFFKKMQSFQFKEFSLKQKFRKLAKDVESFRMEQMKEVLKDMRLAIKAVGQAEGYDLIMRAPEFDEALQAIDAAGEDQARARSAMELVRRFRENPVLYFAKGVDVTDKVLSKLNGDYAKAGGAAGAKKK